MNRVTISIVAFNNLSLTKACIGSILAHTPNFDLIVTNNGSNDGTEQYFNGLVGAFPFVRAVHNKSNLGFGVAHNHALTLCTTPLLLCLNNDCMVGVEWLESLAAPFDDNADVALACPMGDSAQLQPNFIGVRGERREYCSGHCLMVRTEVPRLYGLFDTNLPGLCYCEDADLSLRYRELGYGIRFVHCNVRHLGGATARLIPEARKWLMLNCEFMQKRWKKYLASADRKFPIERLVK